MVSLFHDRALWALLGFPPLTSSGSPAAATLASCSFCLHTSYWSVTHTAKNTCVRGIQLQEPEQATHVTSPQSTKQRTTNSRSQLCVLFQPLLPQGEPFSDFQHHGLVLPVFVLDIDGNGVYAFTLSAFTHKWIYEIHAGCNKHHLFAFLGSIPMYEHTAIARFW